MAKFFIKIHWCGKTNILYITKLFNHDIHIHGKSPALLFVCLFFMATLCVTQKLLKDHSWECWRGEPYMLLKFVIQVRYLQGKCPAHSGPMTYILKHVYKWSNFRIKTTLLLIYHKVYSEVWTQECRHVSSIGSKNE